MIIVGLRLMNGTPVLWIDTDDRTVHDATGGDMQVRPMNAAESARADALVATETRNDARDALRDELAAGVTNLRAARDQAAADATVAQSLRTTALDAKTAAGAQRSAVAAFVPNSTYRAADLAAVRDQLVQVLDRQAAILQALADIYAYRVAVDMNAVTTDDSLLWLARLASDQLDDPTA